MEYTIMKYATNRIALSLAVAVTTALSGMTTCRAEDPPAVPRKNAKGVGKKDGLLDKAQMTSAPTSYSKVFSEAKLEEPTSTIAPELSNPQMPRMGNDKALWNAEVYTWHSPAFCYQPLYFEQPSLERYGIKARPVLNPVISAGHFYVSVFALPWNVVRHRPWECTCTLGQMRPGNCKAPAHNQGIVVQSLTCNALECAPATPEYSVGTFEPPEFIDSRPASEEGTATAEYFQLGNDTPLVPASAKRTAVSVKLKD
jgi:hypothetical protein